MSRLSVLPTPLGPSSATRAPAGNDRHRSRTRVFVPTSTVRPSQASSAVVTAQPSRHLKAGKLGAWARLQASRRGDSTNGQPQDPSAGKIRGQKKPRFEAGYTELLLLSRIRFLWQRLGCGGFILLVVALLFLLLLLFSSSACLCVFWLRCLFTDVEHVLPLAETFFVRTSYRAIDVPQSDKFNLNSQLSAVAAVIVCRYGSICKNCRRRCMTTAGLVPGFR